MLKNWYPLLLSNVRHIPASVDRFAQFCYVVISPDDGESMKLYTQKDYPGLEVFKSYLFDISVKFGKEGKAYLNLHDVKPMK